MNQPKGHLTLKSIRLGVTDGDEIYLCPSGESIFSGDLTISGVLQANEIEPSDNWNLCFPIGQPTDDSVSRPIDISTTQFTDDIGLNLTPTVYGCDGFQLIDRYFKTYWLDTPPAPSSPVYTQETTYFTIDWTNVPTVEAGFLNIELPHITEMRIDYVLSSENGSLDWTGASNTTISTGSKTTDGVRFNTTGSGSGLVGTKWYEYTVLSDTLYDVRIYGVNNHSGDLKYLEVLGCQTLSVGVPNEPTDVERSSSSTTSVGLTWVNPTDHDDTSGGLNTTPVISRYRVDYTAIGTMRYGGLYSPDTGIAYTATTSDPTNADTNLTIYSLLPGTTYTFDVSARNEINPVYGPTGTVDTSTDIPNPPATLTVGGANSLFNEAGLITPYSSSGGYTLDGSTLVDPIINFNNVDGTTNTLNIRTVSTGNIRHNGTAATTDLNITTLSSFAGLTSDYNDLVNTATHDFSGFGTDDAATEQTYTTGKSQLVVSNEEDANSNEFSGFWQHIQMYSQGNDPTVNFIPSVDEYSLGLQYESTQGVGTVTTTPVSFYVDDNGSIPIVSNVGVKNELGATGSGFDVISGIHTFINTAEFQIQFEISGLANKFLRFDKLHATARMLNVSSTVNIRQSDISGSQRYYQSTGTDETSVVLHNTDGLVLTEDPPTIQFNEFTVSLSSLANDTFDEDVQLRITPYNLFGTGTSVDAGYVSNSASPTLKQLRIDTKSVENLASINSTDSLGTQVRSGDGQYPDIGTASDEVGEAYDHTISLLNANYIAEMQMVNGLYQSPTVGDGYQDYTDYFINSTVTMQDYSSIVSSADYRYTTFVYTGLEAGIPSGLTRERLRITINDMTGLTIDTSVPDSSNHRFQIRVVDIGDGTGINDTSTEGWMDASNTVSGLGIQSGTDGTTCLNQSTSTNSQRDCFIRPGTTDGALIYVRIGIQNNLDASFSNISVVAQSGAFS
jgi:hypothetical protein